MDQTGKLGREFARILKSKGINNAFVMVGGYGRATDPPILCGNCGTFFFWDLKLLWNFTLICPDSPDHSPGGGGRNCPFVF